MSRGTAPYWQRRDLSQFNAAISVGFECMYLLQLWRHRVDQNAAGLVFADCEDLDVSSPCCSSCSCTTCDCDSYVDVASMQVGSTGVQQTRCTNTKGLVIGCLSPERTWFPAAKATCVTSVDLHAQSSSEEG